MEFPLNIKIALRALRSNKMRSLLTMLGVIIGIAAVIAMVAIGSGASRVISDQIASVGSNILLVLPGSRTSGGIRMGHGSTPTLTYNDAKAIAAECPSVVFAAPVVRGGAQVVSGNMNWSTSILGVTPEYFSVRDWRVVSGRILGRSDVEGAAKICLIGRTVAENLFGAEYPVGKIVRVKKLPFLVIGVLDGKGRSPQGADQDDVVFVPLTTAQRKLFGSQFPDSVSSIMIQAKSEEELSRAQNQVDALLFQRHRIGPGREMDYTVRNLTELLNVAEQSSRAMSFLLGAVASISLVVGGIGIMNIMLVSVTERTREIGIRMAIGARKKDILLQFLTEAILLTCIGGILGIVLGVVGANVVSMVFDWPTLISFRSIFIAFAFSGATGVFFGYYPAKKAAMLNPIDALRYE